MATVNLGRIKFVWQGAYSGATAYVADDVVSYNGSSYICILASTGNLPTNATYWSLMAQSGTDITSLAGLAQGDVLYYNGTSWVRLGAGTSGQYLKTNGTGANPSWSSVTSSILQVKRVIKSDTFSTSSNTLTDITGLSIDFTPTSSSSWLRIEATLGFHINGTSVGYRIWNSTDSVGISIGDAAGSRTRVTARDNSNHPSWASIAHVVGWYQPNSTSLKNYKIQQGGHGGTTARINFTETNGDDANMDSARPASTMTIWEYQGSIVS
jgi:hypothetical protein